MRADNTADLLVAAQRAASKPSPEPKRRWSHQPTAAGPSPSLCQAAGASRSWLYTPPDLLAGLTRHHATKPTAPARSIRTADQASRKSLLARLHVAHERNLAFTAEIHDLRQQIATLYGRARGR